MCGRETINVMKEPISSHDFEQVLKYQISQDIAMSAV